MNEKLKQKIIRFIETHGYCSVCHGAKQTWNPKGFYESCIYCSGTGLHTDAMEILSGMTDDNSKT